MALLFVDSTSGNQAPLVPEKGASRDLCSCVESWQSKWHWSCWHWISTRGTLPLGSCFEERVPWRGPHPWAPHSLTAVQHLRHCVPKHVSLVWAYRKPPAWICPTRSQSVFLQSINPLNLMFLGLKSAILKQLKHNANTNKNTIHQLCFCKAAGFEVGQFT